MNNGGAIYAWVGIAYVLPQLIVIPPAEILLTDGWLNLYMAMPALLALWGLLFVMFLPEVAPSQS